MPGPTKARPDPIRVRAGIAGRGASFAIALLATGAFAGDCRDDWICVSEVDRSNGVELRASNLREFPITYTLRLRTRQLDVDGPRVVTRTLAPNESAAIMLLSGGKPVRGSNYGYSLDWTVGDKDAVHDDDQLYALPYAPGRAYRVLQGYGSRFSHTGLEEFAIDLDMPVGTPVHAARAGIVARVVEQNDKGCWDDGCGKFANYIVILHSDGTTGEYYHLMKDGAIVDVGDTVDIGQKIGYSGNTGHSTMPHLHFATYRATSGGRTQSIPVRFLSADGIIVRPRRGARYPAR